VSSLILYVETCSPNTKVFGAGGSERFWTINGVSVLVKETLEPSLVFLPCEDTSRSCCL
jgi:hypothetical protein